MKDNASTPASSRHTLRLQLLTNGFLPLPLEGKRTWIKKWTTATIDEAWLENHARKARYQNTGIVCEGIAAVDIDVLDVVLADKVQALVEEELGTSDFIRVGKPPKRLLVYRIVGDTPPRKERSGKYGEHCVEVLAGRCFQFAAFGKYPDPKLNREFEWVGTDEGGDVRSPLNTLCDELPPVDFAKISPLMVKIDALFEAEGLTRMLHGYTADNVPPRLHDLTPDTEFLLDGEVIRWVDLKPLLTKKGFWVNVRRENGEFGDSGAVHAMISKDTNLPVVHDFVRDMTHYEATPNFQLPLPPKSGMFSEAALDGKKPEIRKLAANEVADIVAWKLHGMLGYDDVSLRWMFKHADIWSPLSKNKLRTLVEGQLCSVQPHYSAYSLDSLIRSLLPQRLPAPEFVRSHHLLPLQNGVIDLKTGRLEDYAGFEFDWQLPYGYDPAATCPTVDAWLHAVTGGDEAIVELLICVLRAVVTGRCDLQKFVEIIGPGGTGKGVWTRLNIHFVGAVNTVVTDLKTLETSRFEAVSLYGKRLAVITDATKYAGDAEMLKAITGGDPIRYERKGVDVGEPFIFTGMLMIAANENIQSTDHTSGLSRRRIIIRFDNIISEGEKEKSPDFEDRLVHELPGLLNKVVAISDERVTHVLRNPPEAATRVKNEAELDTNSVLAWANEWLVQCEPDEETLIGIYRRGFMAPGLFPSYVDFCEGQNKHPVSINRFSDLVVDCCRSRRIETEKKRTASGRFLVGLRLRKNSDAGVPTLFRL